MRQWNSAVSWEIPVDCVIPDNMPLSAVNEHLTGGKLNTLLALRYPIDRVQLLVCVCVYCIKIAHSSQRKKTEEDRKEERRPNIEILTKPNANCVP